MTVTTDSLRAQIADIKTRFDADPDAFLASTTTLSVEDFALIGKLIQLFCYADLNARKGGQRRRSNPNGARHLSVIRFMRVIRRPLG